MLSRLNTYGTLFIVVIVVLAFLVRGKLVPMRPFTNGARIVFDCRMTVIISASHQRFLQALRLTAFCDLIRIE